MEVMLFHMSLLESENNILWQVGSLLKMSPSLRTDSLQWNDVISVKITLGEDERHTGEEIWDMWHHFEGGIRDFETEA